jgi:hypothetical protein
MRSRRVLSRVTFATATAGVCFLLLQLYVVLGGQPVPQDRAGTLEATYTLQRPCHGARWRDARSEISIGAIRWDGWFPGSRYERFLDPEQWRDRLPFYGKVLSRNSVQVRADSQTVMNREIAYAAVAGLSYWAFVYYHPQAFPDAELFNSGLRLYLSSQCDREIDFALVLQGSWLGPGQTGWPMTVSTLIDLFSRVTYQRVLGARPLVYLHDPAGMERLFGSQKNARAALDFLKAAAVSRGLQTPYIVGLHWSPAQAAATADALGLDAISSYAAVGGGVREERPFGDLRRANESFWSNATAARRTVVPPVSAGWDPRPRLSDPAQAVVYPGPWYRAPTPRELADHIKAAVTWVEQHPIDAESRTILVYAWNEFDEGGWLAPTLREGDARITALARALGDR